MGVDTDVGGRELTLGLRLRPGALAALTHEHAGAFTDRGVAADAVFGAARRGVADRIGEGDVRAAAAAPVHRAHGWVEHDRANRAWIAGAIERVRALSPAVRERRSRSSTKRPTRSSSP